MDALCPDNYQEYQGSGYCFGFFENDLQTGTNAQTKCIDHVAHLPGEGHLASIRDNATLNWILTTFKDQLTGIGNG